MKYPITIASLLAGYQSGAFTPKEVLLDIIERMGDEDTDHIWISRLTREQVLAYVDKLEGKTPQDLPLFGIPFAIKDNIDLAGIPTTAACPAFSYLPEKSATVVAKLIAAGAIPLGKTNMDQFATGLNGTRSPYGACHNAFNPEYISGGSSSGSAVAVAKGYVAFSLGTDTAGSGRVPAAFNNLIGVKPSLGLLSSQGMVAACRTLDCVSIFAYTTEDAALVLSIAEGEDQQDAYSRKTPKFAPRYMPAHFKFGVPKAEQCQFFGNPETEALFKASIAQLTQLGGTAIEIDFSPFLSAAKLLYEGAWVAERTLSTQKIMSEQPDSVLPVIRQIVTQGHKFSALDTFSGFYQMQSFKRQAETELAKVDVLVTPTAGTIYTIGELEADPIALNSNLGYYTNFMNLFDLSALAVPAGFQPNGLPFGITLVAPAFHDRALLALGQRYQAATAKTLGATGIPYELKPASTKAASGRIRVAVCGAHMSGLPLNHQLTDRGAILIEATTTSPEYRFYALPDGKRPGLIKAQPGAALALEVWEMDEQYFGSFVNGIPAPLGIGRVTLANGENVAGFLCESEAIAGSRDITEFGSWRAWKASS